jgi:hypothetical protein
MEPSAPSLGLIPVAAPGTSPWETIPPGEAAAIDAVLQAIEAKVRAAAAGTTAHRDAHPKAHGCVAAEFRVLNGLPADLAVGLFSQARTYQAWARFSNGSGTPQADKIGDGRGMAIKVMGVDDSASTTQDFILINSPAFFVRDAIDYVAFQNASNPLSFFFPGLNPFRFRLHELGMALAITRRAVTNPLNVQYWTMTPYLFGDRPCKFSARPAGPPASFNDCAAPNFLHDNLVASCAASAAEFEFCVQLRTQAGAMPVEDPTLVWPETASRFIPVARLVIPRQTFDTAERAAFAENLSFTPWHGLEAHRPLGGINRVRRTVYEAISQLRHTLNGVVRQEPSPQSSPHA